jgi:hypothetical protein
MAITLAWRLRETRKELQQRFIIAMAWAEISTGSTTKEF